MGPTEKQKSAVGQRPQLISGTKDVTIPSDPDEFARIWTILAVYTTLRLRRTY